MQHTHCVYLKFIYLFFFLLKKLRGPERVLEGGPEDDPEWGPEGEV